MDSILLSVFERLLDEESKRQQVPLDTAVAAQGMAPTLQRGGDAGSV